ncbi:hypothetical protein [Yersinia bercovieri]|uniref:hypothetical protein n=1 Tax=Yersinia bercovieri TaxID=634 RepID=UPI0011AB6B7F|nr:hypothetical protein [Yersinia bercovieri]
MFYSVIVMADYFTPLLRMFMKLLCSSSFNFFTSPLNKKSATIIQSPEHFTEIKSSQTKQLQQTGLKLSEEKKLDNLISELNESFNYNDDNDKLFPIYMQLWDEINKSKEHRNYVLLEAQADKGKRSDALCCFLVEQGWLVEHANIKLPSESYVLDDLRRDALCQQAIRKLIIKGVQENIQSIVDGKNCPSNGWAKKEHEKQENILSIVCYVLGLAPKKENGAKNRLGQDPISNIVSSITNRACDFIKQNIGGEDPDRRVMHKIVDSYYRCYSNKEKLPSAEIIDKVKDEIMKTVFISSNPQDKDYNTLLDESKTLLGIEDRAYRIISKVILHPVISEKYFQQMESRVLSKHFRQSNGEKNEHISIDKEYLATDETYDIKSSQFYKDIESYLLSINKNLTENDISLCANDYYEFFRKRSGLNVPSLALLEYFQSLSGIQNKRNGFVIGR